MTSSNNLNMQHDEDSLQPSTSHAKKNDRNIKMPSKETQICQLNEDCLLSILKHLAFMDQFNFARSCQQFHSAFVSCVRSKYKVFKPLLEEFAILSTHEQRELLALVGRHILAMVTKLSSDDYTIFELINEFCPNLITLELFIIEMPNMIKLIDNIPKITELKLYSMQTHVNDNDILILRKLVHLKKLTVNLSVIMTGQHLNQLKTLQYLNLKYCLSLKPYHLMEMLEALVDLHTLKFENCNDITLNVCQEMIQHSKKLEYLKIDLNKGFKIIAQLPSLKGLEITFHFDHDIMPMLEELVDKAMQLEYLRIKAFQRGTLPNIALVLGSLKNLKVLQFDIQFKDIDDEWFYHFSKLEHLKHILVLCRDIKIGGGFLQMMSNCKRLSLVEIWFRYSSVTFDSILHKVIALLRSSKEERMLPVTFNCKGLGTKDAEYRKAVEDGIIRIYNVRELIN